jgi:riboflavin kinase/FMN adenylyltransferase
VATFSPHPCQVLADTGYKPLFTLAERAYILRRLGVDYLLEFPFDNDFAAMHPEDFCTLLLKSLRARVLVVGEGYRFGKGRGGTVETLAQACRSRAFSTEMVMLPPQTQTGTAQKISTSDIRALIAARRLGDAAGLLGFPFFIMGTVRHGQQIGRTMGFPTVNTEVSPEKFLPPDGVYITRTRIIKPADKTASDADARTVDINGETNHAAYRSVTNVGLRPTVAGQTAAVRTVESFLLGFDCDLYGAEIMTEFITFLRPEKRFGNMEQLREQIKKDIARMV